MYGWQNIKNLSLHKIIVLTDKNFQVFNLYLLLLTHASANSKLVHARVCSKKTQPKQWQEFLSSAIPFTSSPFLNILALMIKVIYKTDKLVSPKFLVLNTFYKCFEGYNFYLILVVQNKKDRAQFKCVFSICLGPTKPAIILIFLRIQKFWVRKWRM